MSKPRSTAGDSQLSKFGEEAEAEAECGICGFQTHSEEEFENHDCEEEST